MDQRKISPPFQLPLRHLQYKSFISDSRHSKSLVENRKKIRRETLVRSRRSGCDVSSESEKRGGAERVREVREVRAEWEKWRRGGEGIAAHDVLYPLDAWRKWALLYDMWAQHVIAISSDMWAQHVIAISSDAT
jgi:hypothetical protein